MKKVVAVTVILRDERQLMTAFAEPKTEAQALEVAKATYQSEMCGKVPSDRIAGKARTCTDKTTKVFVNQADKPLAWVTMQYEGEAND